MTLEVLVMSCDRYAPIWPIWRACWNTYWTGPAYPWHIVSNQIEDAAFHTISTGPDVFGWNTCLLLALERVKSDLVLFGMDDNWIGPERNQSYAENLRRVEKTFDQHDVSAFKIGMTWDPDEPWPEWDRVGILDRAPHPFKRTSLATLTVYQREVLADIARGVTAAGSDKWGRDGAIEFEVFGTRLTEDEKRFPGVFLGVRRDVGAPPGLVETLCGDGITSNRIRLHGSDLEAAEYALGCSLDSLPGIQPFLRPPDQEPTK